MASLQSTPANVEKLRKQLRRQTELYDLHTHLLGMGDHKFWVDGILMNTTILPTDADFKDKAHLRKELCRLVWDSNNPGFLHGDQADIIFQYLIEMNYPSGNWEQLNTLIEKVFSKPTLTDPNQPNTSWEEVKDSIHRVLPKSRSINTNRLNEILEKLKALIEPELSDQEPIFYSMVKENNKFARELRNRGLSFRKDFNYDVILKLNDLAKGLGVSDRSSELIQAAVEEKLCFHVTHSSNRPRFRHWIIFNARIQCFEVVYGITVDELRHIIQVDKNEIKKANKLARANIVNAFSMRGAHDTKARPTDFQTFQGMFTPEFYPRRFALKDSIYSQRLDVLARLLYHVLDRYDTCRPQVTYCELSVGVGDLTRPWVFDVLCTFASSKQTSHQSSTTSTQVLTNSNKTNTFRDLLMQKHFPSLEDAVIKGVEGPQTSISGAPKCVYKFLAGFNRQHVQTPYFRNQKEAIDLLNEAPQIAIHVMLNEISKSVRKEDITEQNDVFYQHVQDLEKIKKAATKNSSYHDWVVGFDLFGDEMGFPYCPFVARDFIDYVSEVRKNNNSSFGLRIHCGENVPFADATAPAYRYFAAHMYIAFRCLRYLQHELEYGIRVGHGIAFQRILDGTMNRSEHRKSSVLLAEIEFHAPYVFGTIPFEVNITSNEYLLGHALRNGDFDQALRLNALLKLKVPIILATDNDGIWPINKCSCGDRNHFSLSSECSRAISTGIIDSLEHLETMFKNMKTFRFYSDGKKSTMPKADIWILPHDTSAFTTIMHPDIIKFIIKHCNIAKNMKYGKFYDDFSEICQLEEINMMNKEHYFKQKISNDMCLCLGRIAYVSYCAVNLETNPELTTDMQEQYNAIFDSNPHVTKVLQEWKSVYQQLIKPNIIDQSQCVSTDSGEHVFFSEGPFTAHKDKTRPMKDLIDYLQRHYHYNKKTRIYAFTRQINVEATVKKIEQQLQRQYHADLRVYIYSNKGKEQYEDFDLSEKIQLEVNQTSLKRADPINKEQQNGLYAVCPHASAATAFLHLISKELSNSGNTQPSIPDADLRPPTQSNEVIVTDSSNTAISSKIDDEITSP